MNVLSLDAPIIAVVWQELFARVFEVALQPAEREILAAAVWLAYSADRWLDGRQIPSGAATTPRHRFAQRHGRWLPLPWLLVLIGAVTLAWRAVPHEHLVFGTALTAMVLLHLWLNRRQREWEGIRGFKEIAVASLFALGTIFFVHLRLAAFNAALWGGAVLWAGLVFLNCAFIAAWEKKRDQAQGECSIITRWPGLEAHLLKAGYAWAALATFIALAWRENPVSRIAAPVVTSTLILMVIAKVGGSMEIEKRRTLADLALLTPLLWWSRFPGSG